ncbi:MAG: ribosomal-processing cysteine protease Prp [Synergistaceae bacterium]|jgi:uncharacterized protein YsxB (DUF464 family)|nr:ribosomal-processing cysteine protease Prp [Synergistaceae bacterium]
MEVTAEHDSGGICRIQAQGHTGYSDPGTDIVCAAVSALVQALGVGFGDVLRLEGVRIERDRENALISYEWDSSVAEAQCIARTILLSLKAVAESYPEFVAVREFF